MRISRRIRKRAQLVCVMGPKCLGREYLLQILENDPAVRIVDFEQLVSQAGRERLSPIFILEGCGMPLLLTECLRRLRIHFPLAKSIVLDRDKSIEDIVRLLWYGVQGFLAHHEVRATLLPAVHGVAEGQMWVARKALQAYAQQEATIRENHSHGSTVLTSRENQILELVKRRLSNKEIAGICKVRESTVKFHLSNIFEKLHVSSRRALTDTDGTRIGWPELALLGALPPH